MNWFKQRKQRKHCNHFEQRGIYGDEIEACGGFRAQCVKCGTYLWLIPSVFTASRTVGKSQGVSERMAAMQEHPAGSGLKGNDISFAVIDELGSHKQTKALFNIDTVAPVDPEKIIEWLDEKLNIPLHSYQENYIRRIYGHTNGPPEASSGEVE